MRKAEHWVGVLGVCAAGLLGSACGGSKPATQTGARTASEADAQAYMVATGLDTTCHKLQQRLGSLARAEKDSAAAPLMEEWARVALEPEALCRDIRRYLATEVEPPRLADGLRAMGHPGVRRVVEALGTEDSEEVKRRLERARTRPAPTEAQKSLLVAAVERGGDLDSAAEVGAHLSLVSLMARAAAEGGYSVMLTRVLDRQEEHAAGMKKAMVSRMGAGLAVLLSEVAEDDLRAFVAMLDTPVGTDGPRWRALALRSALDAGTRRWVARNVADPRVPLDFSPIPATPLQPAPCLDLPACRAQCDGGRADACVGVSMALETGTGVTADRKGALETMEKACGLGLASACTQAAWQALHALEGESRRQRVRALRQKACQQQDAWSCANLEREAIHEAATTPGRAGFLERAQALAARCNDRDVVGCTVLANLHMQGVGVPSDGLAMERALETGCRGGDLASCQWLGDAFMFGYGPLRKDPERANRLLQEGCEVRKDAHACNNWADQMEWGRGTAQDLPRAFEVYQRACNGGEGMGCLSMGTMYERGHGREKDLLRAAQMYDRACQLALDEGCRFLERVRKGRDLSEEE